MKHIKIKENYMRDARITFDLPFLYKFVFAAPVFAFIICIVLTLLLNFESSTATHCNVPNYLPSVSSAIGGFKLQKYIWQFFIALQCSPRILLALCYHKYYVTFPSAALANLHLYILTFVDIVENLSLLFLTIVSSIEAYDYHFWGFITFLVCSQLHMILKLQMNYRIQNDPQFCFLHKQSFRLKKMLWTANLFFIFLSVYFFYRHNYFCEHGVYTLFALCEYIIVVSNIAFQGTGFYEFHKSVLRVDRDYKE